MTVNQQQPLADRMRPANLDEVIGQDHVLKPGSALRRIAEGVSRNSILLWSDPGQGKTSIAIAIAESTKSNFVELSATSAGVKDVRTVIDQAQKLRNSEDKNTILFLDEIHRFSKAQQDILLPVVEKGAVSLIGATTENPSFSVNKALLSRSTLIRLNPLDEQHLVEIMKRAISSPNGLNNTVVVEDHALDAIARTASGDARQALTLLEEIAASATSLNRTEPIDTEFVLQIAPKSVAHYDPNGDQHYDIISAFIKSMRGSDPDAAVYWMARMIDAGEDPRYIARRLMVHASEDVGMADPMAMLQAVAAAQVVQLVGMPEAKHSLSQAAIYIATAPKSSAAHDAINDALSLVAQGGSHPVPIPLRDSSYPGAKFYGHGDGYLYPHQYPHGLVKQNYLPEDLVGIKLYEPRPIGHEATIANRMEAIKPVAEKNLESGPIHPPPSCME